MMFKLPKCFDYKLASERASKQGVGSLLSSSAAHHRRCFMRKKMLNDGLCNRLKSSKIVNADDLKIFRVIS